MFDPVEEMIKQNLKKRDSLSSSKEGCPSEKELWDYLNGLLAKEAEGKVAEHIVQCDVCLDALLLAQEVRPGIGFGPSDSPSGELLGNAIALAKGKRPSKTHAKKQSWLFLSLLSIGISFFLPRYFFQCLILGVIFGLKWVFDTTTNRTLIVMYDALKQKNVKRDDASKRLEWKDHEEKGFTLIELVIVITILAILAAVAIPAFQNMQTHAKNAATKAALGAFRSGIQMYRMNEITSGRARGTAGNFPDNGCPGAEMISIEDRGPQPPGLGFVVEGAVNPENPWARGIITPGLEDWVVLTVNRNDAINRNAGLTDQGRPGGWDYYYGIAGGGCEIWANTAANGGVNNPNDPDPTENWF